MYIICTLTCCKISTSYIHRNPIWKKKSTHAQLKIRTFKSSRKNLIIVKIQQVWFYHKLSKTFTKSKLLIRSIHSILKLHTQNNISVEDHSTNFCPLGTCIKKKTNTAGSSRHGELILDKLEIILFLHQMIKFSGLSNGHFIQPSWNKDAEKRVIICVC